jgi:hypothetical protein
MKTSRAILFGVLVLTAVHVSTHCAAADPKGDLDTNYVIVLDETPGGQPFKPAAEALGKLRAPATLVPLTPSGLGPVFEKLKQLKPKYVAFVVPPGRIEDNFVGEVFQRASRLDDASELDFAYGYITGATSEDAVTLVRNTGRAEKERASIPKTFVAIGQTFAEADLGMFAYQQAALLERYGYRALPINPIDDSPDWQRRARSELRQFQNASLVFFAGHGLGDWMCGIHADALAGIQLDRAVVVSGPCHSAVTTLRHDVEPGGRGVKSVSIPPERSICLNLIKAGAVSQLGSTASSSWGNVGPVITGFFNEAATMGEALRDRLNDHIRQHGLGEFTVMRFEEGKPSPPIYSRRTEPCGHPVAGAPGADWRSRLPAISAKATDPAHAAGGRARASHAGDRRPRPGRQPAAARKRSVEGHGGRIDRGAQHGSFC